MTAGAPIPQVDVRAVLADAGDRVRAAMDRVLRSGWYILGGEVRAFEEAFAAYLGVPYAIGVGNGTDAVELALRAEGVEAGDRVATVSHTAVATVAAIRRIGAIPVWVDIDESTYTLSPDAFGRVLASSRGAGVKAVVVVHLYGCPADMPAILAIARERGLRVVEDCAQAHGASREGRRMGAWGDAAAFSFYPTKNLGAMGDGGMVVTRDADTASRLRAWRQYGWVERFISSTEGVNSRLDEVQAAILRELLPGLDAGNRRRRAIAAVYDDGLRDVPVIRPVVPAGAEHAFHQYVIRVPARQALRDGLRERGVETAVHYPMPVHRQPAYAAFAEGADLAVTERIAHDILSLPMFPALTPEQTTRVVLAVRSVLGMPA